jgi:hypoxanthine phosphoribosyltransferase
MELITIDQREFNGYVANICRQIAKTNWKPDYVVGIGRGGAVPAVMISQYFDIPYHSVGVNLHTHSNTEHNCWISCDAFGESGERKNILVVDDLNETGETLNWIVDDWQSSCLPDSPEWDSIWNANVKFAVVADNTTSKFNKNIDFCGFEMHYPKEEYLITFPYSRWWQL